MPPISLGQEYINKLIDISKNAGDAIMDIYESEFDVNFKSDQSHLTEADILSNKIICQSLKKIAPDVPVLSEESSDIPYEQRSKWNQYWLIDPLDGTKEFIKKNGEFTVNIALIENNTPIFGVINAPALSKTYWGCENLGSFLIDQKLQETKITVSNKRMGKLRILASRSHPSNDLDTLLNRIGEYELINVGSSLKFCLVASGEADCYPRFGPTCEWDTAAGQAILTFAGGGVLTLSNETLSYNSKESLRNPSFIADNRKIDLIKYQ